MLCATCGCSDFEANNFQPDKCKNCQHTHSKVISNEFVPKVATEQKVTKTNSPVVSVGKKGSYRRAVQRQNSKPGMQSDQIFPSYKKLPRPPGAANNAGQSKPLPTPPSTPNSTPPSTPNIEERKLSNKKKQPSKIANL